MKTVTQPNVEGQRASLTRQYRRVREMSERICQPLTPEDCVIQSMPDVSPTRWHLAHTTWFFEQFVLATRPDYRVFDERYCYLFNSYYNAVGQQFPRAQRGCISRPGLSDVADYRHYVDEHMLRRLEAGELDDALTDVVQTGLHHEQQHQELMLTDIKHVLSCNPLWPAYRDVSIARSVIPAEKASVFFEEGIFEIGCAGDGFCFDNEKPCHRVFCEPFSISSMPVTCGEFLQFVNDGGYQRPEHWLSLGWQSVQERHWQAPLYWVPVEDDWQIFTLAGLQPMDADQPVCHVSYFEADAYARWAGRRLPTEQEWEVASNCVEVAGQFVDHILDADQVPHPTMAPGGDGPLSDMFGGVWEWTGSQYLPYPGYRPPPGALGEYNGKFMCNQFVLRGGSCATSSDHVRRSYRNFFPPECRWQFSGFRLAGV